MWMFVLAAGCGRQDSRGPSGPARYGALTNQPSSSVPRALPDHSGEQPWLKSEFAVVQTELSPATLFHSKSTSLAFFTHMPGTGIGGPAFVAMTTPLGPKVSQAGGTLAATNMIESWVLVWFAGAAGWTNWDAPWLVTIQRKPASIEFSTNGLRFTFAGEAGYAAMMPLYGYYKPPQQGRESSQLYALKEKKKRVTTWKWAAGLQKDPLARARYWASALKEFPVYCEESVSVNRGNDSVTIRQKFRFVSWNDEWNTHHLKLAPVSPVLAHAFREGFSAQFSKKPFDMEIFTSFGPYYGIEKADSYEVTLPVLRYVHETHGAGEVVEGYVEAPCFTAWQKAHASNDWEGAQQQWPRLRAQFRARSELRWPAFAAAETLSPLEQTANALGAARVAYRLGDADTYVQACDRFARAITQLWVQQRGLNYIREWQPWHSMDVIPEDARLTMLDQNGWRIGQPAPARDLASAPDLVRILRGVQPASHVRALNDSTGTRERLIPGAAATGRIAVAENAAILSNAFLMHEFVTGADGAREADWPRIAWSDWKTPAGSPWNFGQVVPFTNAPEEVETTALNRNTRVMVYSAR